MSSGPRPMEADDRVDVNFILIEEMGKEKFLQNSRILHYPHRAAKRR